MARTLYIDGFSGAAGDMLLGAFLDAGLPEEALREALGSLGVGHELRRDASGPRGSVSGARQGEERGRQSACPRASLGEGGAALAPARARRAPGIEQPSTITGR